MAWARAVSVMRLGFRNVLRNGRRNSITASSIGLGVLVSLLIVGVRDDSYRRLVDAASQLGLGHLTVAAATADHRWINAENVLSRIAGQKGIRSAAPRLTGDGVLAHADQSRPVKIVAMAALEDDGQKIFREHLVSGQFITDDKPSGIVLGQTLAQILHLSLGSKAVLTTGNASGSVASDLFTVVGVLGTGSDEIDRHLVVAQLPHIQSLVGIDSHQVSAISIVLEDYRQSDEILARIRSLLQPDNTVEVATWEKLQPDLASYMIIDKLTHRVILIFIGLVIALGIYATVFMNISERRREFGIMKCLGMQPPLVLGAIGAESVVVSLGGVAIGWVAALGPYLYLRNVGLDISRWVGDSVDAGGTAISLVLGCQLEWDHAAIIMLLVFVFAMLATIGPAARIARSEAMELLQVTGQ